MTAEQYWELHKNEVLAELKDAGNEDEILVVYHRFWESLKVHVLSCFEHEEILRQQIILLFIEADKAADILRVREAPQVTLVHKTPEKMKWLHRILISPVPACVAAFLGVALGINAGRKVWYLTLLFAITAALLLYHFKTDAEFPKSGYTVKVSINQKLLEHQILRQVQLVDAHIADLKALQNDLLTPMNDILPDKTSISLCQYVWGNAHQGYPINSTLMMAEKMMRQNDMEWVPYQEDTTAFFDVMPTRRESRMVYPALRKISDGTLLCKGQYLKDND